MLKFRRLLALSFLSAASLAQAQEVGAAWFFERGRSQPVLLAPVGKLDRVFGFDLSLDVSVLVRPLDGVRLGAAVAYSAPVARNAWLTVGIGVLASDRFEWSSVRPGLVIGIAVRF